MAPVLLVVALAVVVVFTVRKNMALSKSVRGLNKQVTELSKPKPFGLWALKNVGRALGKLTPEVVRISFAAAQVCERPNTVANDLAEEIDQKSSSIAQTMTEIVNLKQSLATAEQEIENLRALRANLGEIQLMLPEVSS